MSQDQETEAEVTLDVGGRNPTASFAAGIALGALLGAAVALLFAPERGRITRDKLRRRLEDAREYAEDEFDDLRKRARKEIRRRIG